MSWPIPSHHISPSGVRAVFVKIVFARHESMALGFVFIDVYGATPKKPYSGLIAYKRPSFPNFIQAISSPTHSTFHPGIVGISIARFVLPHALGNAAAKYFLIPAGFVIPIMSICSASQPSLRAILEAILRAKHFFPRSAFPP